jgi:hypothetical protein
MDHSIKTSTDSNAAGGAAQSTRPPIGPAHRHYLWRCRRIQKLSTRRGTSSNIYGKLCSEIMIHFSSQMIFNLDSAPAFDSI